MFLRKNTIQEVDEVDKQIKLVSDEKVPLHIVVFKKGDDLSSQHIAGFGAVVKSHPGAASWARCWHCRCRTTCST